MREFLGLGAFRGYTMGPCFHVETWKDLERLTRARMPVIAVVRSPWSGMMGKLDPMRVLGIVTDHGSVLDPTYEELADVSKPSVVGASGVFEAATRDALVIVDAAEGRVILEPDPKTLRRYQRLKGTKPPSQSPYVRTLLDQLLTPIRQAWVGGGKTRPFDLPEQRWLYDIVVRTANGQRPTPEDDELVRGLLFERSGLEKYQAMHAKRLERQAIKKDYEEAREIPARDVTSPEGADHAADSADPEPNASGDSPS
ncbi:MAG: hypothetical protein ACYS22_17655 [Planctomycetota bacterium]|jgi:hypothetical protein